MPNAKNLSIKNMRIKGIIKGAPKTGKTQFLGTWPDLFAFVFDSGIKTLLGQDVNYKEYFDNDPEKPVAFTNAKKDLDSAIKSARVNGKVIYDEERDCFVEQKVKEIKAPLKHIKTIGVDCAGPLLEAIMNYTQYTRGTAGDTPCEYDWFPQMNQFSKFFDRVLGLPCHVWLVSYEKVKEVKSRKGDISFGTRVLPDLTGRLAMVYEGRFDICVRSVVERVGGKTTYKLQATYKGLYEAGHRFQDAFDLYIEPPTYEQIMKQIDEYTARKLEVAERLRDHE